MPNNGITPKQYVSLESLSIFLEKIKTAYKTNTSNANEKFPVHYAETAGQLDHSIVFKDGSNNVIGTWGAGDSEIVLTVTGGGSLPSGVTVLKFKGVKPTRAALDNLAAEDGDVWIIESDNSEYVWVPAIPAEGEEGQEGYKPAVDAHWEQLGATIDLSSYVTEAELQQGYYTKSETDLNFVKKVDSVTAEDINALFVEDEPEPEPVHHLISASGVYKKAVIDTLSDPDDQEHTIVINPESSDISELPDDIKFPGLHWIEWQNGCYAIGNTNLISDWGYTGQPVATDCPVCIVYIDGCIRKLAIMSDDVLEEGPDFIFAYYTGEGSSSMQGTAQNCIYSNPCVAWKDTSYSFLNSSPLSEEEIECLKSADGKSIKLTADGVEYDAVISYNEGRDEVTLNISDSDLYVAAAKSWSTGESSPYYLVADKSNGNDPSTIENNTAFSISVDLDSITESSASAGGGTSDGGGK